MGIFWEGYFLESFRQEASNKRYDVPNVADTLTKEEILYRARRSALRICTMLSPRP